MSDTIQTFLCYSPHDPLRSTTITLGGQLKAVMLNQQATLKFDALTFSENQYYEYIS